jgi:hypothetical protein
VLSEDKTPETFSGELHPLPRFQYYLEGNNFSFYPKVKFRVDFVLLDLFNVCSIFVFVLDVDCKNMIDISNAEFVMLFYFTLEKHLNDSFQFSCFHSTP